MFCIKKNISVQVMVRVQSVSTCNRLYFGRKRILTMDTIQLSGVDSTDRKTRGTLGKNAKLIIKERNYDIW